MRNLSVSNSTSHKIVKSEIHTLVFNLTKELDFRLKSVDVNFVEGDEIITINKSYLGHNFSTDIITFNYSGENDTLDGEIFISLNDASFNAKRYNCELSNEIVRLIIHGFLHLIGYDDKSLNDKKKMKRIENRLVKKYFNSLTKFADNI